jgi:hypothetical protein
MSKDFKRPWRWRKRARLQLAEHPLCAICLQSGKVEAAKVCDHIEPHRGDVNKFWTGPLQSLCWSCHSMIKQQQEVNGFSTAIGPDGWPIDQNHPAYKN